MSTIKKTGNEIHVHVSVFLYKDADYPDGDMYIAYCPALDLTGYDTTEEGARESFQTVMEEYLEYTSAHGTLESDLKAHGWRKTNGKIVEPTYPFLYRTGRLENIIQANECKKYPVPVFV